MRSVVAFACIICVVLTGTAWAGSARMTLAGFADPTGTEGAPPLFTYSAVSNTLSGSWTGTGLTLQASAAAFADVTFEMDAVDVLSPTLPALLGAGEINFYYTNPVVPILTIAFTSGAADLATVAFGASEVFVPDSVTFTGDPAIVSPGLFQESFAFAFANQTLTDGEGGFTATATFISSALPEPGSLVLLLAGAVLLNRRR